MSAVSFSPDSRDYRQALVVLDRERLSPGEQRLFLWFTRAVWGTIVFLLVWPPVLLSGNEQQHLVLAMAVVSFFAAAILFVANLGVAGRLVRAALTERRLGVRRHVSRLTVSVARRRGWAARTWDAKERVLGTLGHPGAGHRPFVVVGRSRCVSVGPSRNAAQGGGFCLTPWGCVYSASPASACGR